MDELKKKWQNDILSRLFWVHLVLIFVVAGLFARLIYIQYFDTLTADYSKAVHKSLISSEPVYATRGDILSHDGSQLSTSILRRAIFFDFASHGFDNQQRFTEQADSLSKLLSAYFGDHSPAWYFERMRSTRAKALRYVADGYDTIKYSKGFFEELVGIENADSLAPRYKVERSHTYTRLFRDIDGNEWEKLRHFPILNHSLGKVYITEFHDTRVYPHGNLAMRTIGRTDVENPYGIEQAYKDSLAGINGKDYYQYMAPNFYAKIENDTLQSIPAINGADIVTTINTDVQDVADKALREQLMAQNGIWGTTVVMECSTGDIVALVNLSRTSNGKYVEGPNHAIGTPMEPGSTLKLATALILLDDAKMPPDKKYHSGLGKRVKVGKYNNIQDSHAIGKQTKGSIDLKTAFTESANVYFAKAVLEYYGDNQKGYYDALCRLHLDHHTAFEEFSPRPPFMPKPKSSDWSGATLANLAYGYGLEITPMQTLTLYNAVANGGKMVAPRLIKQIRRGKKSVADYPVKVIEDSICSASTLALLRQYLEQVALTGTARKSFGEDATPFRVGAKTGTASLAMGAKYSEGYHLGSMVTYMPADNPRYTLITAIYKKKGQGSVFGADLAGPVQQQVASFLYNREEQWADHLVVSDVKQLPTTIKGGYTEYIGAVARNLDMTTSYTSPSGWGTASVGLSSVNITSTTDNLRLVPDVLGMGLSDALFLLENRGLKVEFSGAGAVVWQSRQSGSSFKTGDKIVLKLE